ncbi:winged helix-turn-helix domain-containing protein [Streptosporangium sp. NBC_01495]|uniref:AfsR/SARP family transcriptional regulator n=1 Tax=Streptosporangium sp. NBC_01495 TaxID=2903899 RepID=UPI002E35AFD3|nr:BTAD domain-containing putative transcriptional regulator [Streptosporangium sp. NBC_01495]
MDETHATAPVGEDLPAGRLGIDILGTVTGRRGSQRLDLGEPRQQAVLCVLAINAGQVVTKDRLIDAVWGESPPKTAGQSVYTYVSRLRRTLDPGRDPRRPSGVLVSVSGGYSLRLAPEQVDALVFEQRLDQAGKARAENAYETSMRSLDRAAELWRGTCLSGIPGPFAELERHRLSGLRLTALELHADLLLLLGRPQEAAARLVLLTSEHPLRERLRELYMIALYRCDRQVEALRVYQETRRLLMEEFGVQPHESLRRCHELILRADPLLGPPSAPLPSPEPIPSSGPSLEPDARERRSPDSRRRTAERTKVARQLPRDPVDFVGRAEELARLRALLSPRDGAPPHHVVAITGAPGSGKSTLAVRAAHMVRDRFPGGQLYVNLRGATPGMRRLQPIEVLGRFLRDLGTPPHAVPADVDEAAALWRGELDGREILVVLDDAADLAQIRPLLSVPMGNAILTTSRESFTLLDDCARVPISGMRRAESSAMLTKLIGAERAAEDPRATMRLIDLCGDLPLAVGIAGARLANRPRWNVTDLVSRLDDERGRLRELSAGDLAVRSSLAVSYEMLAGSDHRLDRTAARALRALGVLQTADVTAHLVGALLGVPVDTAEHAMERLVDAHLSEMDEPGRYRLHDLVRLFAKERVAHEETEGDRDAALDRALSLYLGTTLLAVKLCGYPRTVPTDLELGAGLLPLASGRQARDWLDQEQANLVSAASQAMGAPGERIARLGAALAFALFWHLQHAGLPARLQSLNRQALSVGRRLNDHRIEANAHNHLGSALNMVGRLEEAQNHIRRQLVLSRRLSDLHGEQKALGSLAMNYLELGRYEKALSCGEAQRKVTMQAGHVSGEHFALTMIGSAYHGMRRTGQALAVLEEALSRCRRDGNRYQETSVHEKLGRVHLDRGDPESARNSFEDGLGCARAVKLKIAEPYLLLGLARSSRLLGETDRAAAYLALSLSAARAVGNPVVERLTEEEATILTASAKPVTAGRARP